MKGKATKAGIGVLMTLLSVLPALANSSDITINGTYQDVLSVQLERTSDDFIVSKDNVDPNSTITGNATLNFGNVNPLGLDLSTDSYVNTAVTGTNNVTGTVKAFVIDSTDKLYDSLEQLGTASRKLPKGVLGTPNNKGALYYIEDAVQLRILRGGGAGTPPELTAVDFRSTGTALVQSFAKLSTGVTTDVATLQTGGTSLTPNLALNGDATLKSLGTGLTYDAPYKLDIGMTVPYSLPKNSTTVSTVITFIGA